MSDLVDMAVVASVVASEVAFEVVPFVVAASPGFVVHRAVSWV